MRDLLEAILFHLQHTSADWNKGLDLAQQLYDRLHGEARPDWEDYFFDLADMAATRATCPRAHCGCVLVRHKRVLSMGYNGAPPGEPHCTDVGCDMQPCHHTTFHNDDPRHPASVPYMKVQHPGGHCRRTTHAEVSALLNCVASPQGSTAYVTGTPCPDCVKALHSVGVTDVRWRREYPAKDTK